MAHQQDLVDVLGSFTPRIVRMHAGGEQVGITVAKPFVMLIWRPPAEAAWLTVGGLL